MNNGSLDDQTHSSKPAMADISTYLSYERTRFAADRTLMAWIRTSLSMISFGFTIYKFFQYLWESNVMAGELVYRGPKNLGLTLVILGTILLLFAIAEYFLFQRRLSRELNKKFPISTTLVAAFLMSIIGMLALVNLFFRVGPF